MRPCHYSRVFFKVQADQASSVAVVIADWVIRGIFAPRSCLEKHAHLSYKHDIPFDLLGQEWAMPLEPAES